MGIPINHVNPSVGHDHIEKVGEATDGQLKKQMEQLGALLSELEGEIAQFAHSNESSHYKMNNGMVNSAGDAVRKAVNALKTLEHDEAAAAAAKRNHHWWDKVLEIVLPVVTAVACLFSPEAVPLLIIAMTFLVAQKTGLMKDALEGKNGHGGLTRLFEDMGVPPTVAHLLASITVVLVTIAATEGAAAPEAATEEGGMEAAEDASAETGAAADEGGEEATMSATTESTDDSSSFKLKNLGKNLSRRSALTIMAGTTALTSSGFSTNLVNVIAKYGHLSKKQKEELEIAITVLIAVMAILASGASMNGLMNGSAAEETTLAGGLARKAGGCLKNFPKAADGAAALGSLLPTASRSLLFKGLMGTEVAGEGVEAGLDFGLMKQENKVANEIRELGKDKALTDLYQELAKSGDSQFSSMLHTTTKELDNENHALAALGQSYSGTNAAVARVLAG